MSYNNHKFADNNDKTSAKLIKENIAANKYLSKSIMYYLVGICLLGLIGLFGLIGFSFFSVGFSTHSIVTKQKINISTPKITKTIPHDDSCYTQGLYFNQIDGYLYESCGLFGKSKLRRVHPNTGKVIHNVNVDPSLFAEGIWIHGDDLIMLTWKSKKLLVYDWRLLTLRNTYEFETTTGEGWGIAGNATNLMVTDGSHYIHFWDINEYHLSPTGSKIPVTLQLPNSPVSDVTLLNEVELVNSGELLANVYGSQFIMRIDVKTGDTKGIYDFKGVLEQYGDPSGTPEVMNGIAYNERTGDVYFTGKRWKSMFIFNIHD